MHPSEYTRYSNLNNSQWSEQEVDSTVSVQSYDTPSMSELLFASKITEN